jgi:hypothetical protein
MTESTKADDKDSHVIITKSHDKTFKELGYVYMFLDHGFCSLQAGAAPCCWLVQLIFPARQSS